MIRHRFAAASALSLLLCAAVVAIWPRTVSVCDTFTYVTASGKSYSFGTAPSHLSMFVTRGWPPIAPEYRNRGFALPSPGWSSSSIRWGTYSEPHGVPQEWSPPAHGFLGIGWESYTSTFGPPVFARSANVQSALWVIPLWLVLIVAAALPTVWLAKRLRAHRRRRQGQCLACGYDLRASTGRCPECGMPISLRERGTVGTSDRPHFS